VCTLAHIFESAGLATVVLASMRPVAEKMHPPRALYCEFPLGRPLGRPGDAVFQRDVLVRGLSLLERPSGPVLEDHPTIIEADETPLSCALPPRFDPDEHPAVEEAKGLRKAYDRAAERRGISSVGRVLGPDDVPAALLEFDRIAKGDDWLEVDLPGSDTISSVHDIRTYYEEAALELVDGPVPDGRAAEAWFYETTQAGKTIMAARQSMKDAGVPNPFWYYMAPGHR
jgi:hypothetical protein